MRSSKLLAKRQSELLRLIACSTRCILRGHVAKPSPHYVLSPLYLVRDVQPFRSCSKIRLFFEIYLYTPARVADHGDTYSIFTSALLQLKFGHLQIIIHHCEPVLDRFIHLESVNAFAQDNRHRCANNGQYKLRAENFFIHPSFKHATQRGILKLCSHVKIDFVRELHAIAIPPPLQLREIVKIIAVPQTIYSTSQRTSITMQQILLSAPSAPTPFLCRV